MKSTGVLQAAIYMLLFALLSTTNLAAFGQKEPVVASQETVSEEAASEVTGGDDSRYAGSTPAPKFAEGVEWLNVPRPLTWSDLTGKVVVLDFWTYGCINCMHMIPVLEKLQDKYQDELVIIGVHSAKFETEGKTENIRQIVQRYGRTEPVINDKDFRVWQSWGARAWPTIAVVDPRGNVVGMDSGEFPFEVLDGLVGGIIDYFGGLGLLDHEAPALEPEGAGEPNSLLFFQEKFLPRLLSIYS